MDLKNIIVATDLSDHCGMAAQWAQSFKEHVGATHLVVEHVIELSLKSWVGSAFEVLDNPETRAAAEEKVAAWYEQHTGVRPDEVLLRAGSCLTQLTQAVEEQEGNTMLVVSMSGKGAMTRFFLGSTAHALASQPPCPVAVVHPDHASVTEGIPVLTGTDLSFNGQRAVAYAAQIARSTGVPLEIIHAHGAPTSLVLADLEHPVAEETTVKVATKKISAQPELAGVDTRITVVPKDPGPAIVERAVALGSDIIVLGHSGESLFVQNVLGSVAQRVLNRMPCTMIIVPGVPHDGTYDAEEE